MLNFRDSEIIKELEALSERNAEDQIYLLVLEEMEDTKKFDVVAHAKALEEAHGDDTKADALYIKHRVRRLMDILKREKLERELDNRLNKNQYQKEEIQLQMAIAKKTSIEGFEFLRAFVRRMVKAALLGLAYFIIYGGGFAAIFFLLIEFWYLAESSALVPGIICSGASMGVYLLRREVVGNPVQFQKIPQFFVGLFSLSIFVVFWPIHKLRRSVESVQNVFLKYLIYVCLWLITFILICLGLALLLLYVLEPDSSDKLVPGIILLTVASGLFFINSLDK